MVFLSLLLSGLPAQNTSSTSPSNTASTEGRKLGRVEGTVVNAITNAPLARAMVMLQPMSRSGGSSGPMILADGFGQMVPQDTPMSGATGADGKFVIENVPEGKYAPLAARATFLKGYYAGPGVRGSIEIAAGASVKDITIKLTPQSVISGRVVDADGEPIQNVMIAAARYNYTNGQRNLMPFGTAQSNDLGEYRISSLQPGKYFLAAVPGLRSTTAGPSGSREAIPLTYYPNAFEITGATQVMVDPGGDVHGMDFRLTRQPAVIVSGKVAGLPEGAMPSANLVPDQSLGMLGRMVPHLIPVRNGTFAIPGVLPGSYELQIDMRTSKSPIPLYGRLHVEVGKEDVKGLNIAVEPGAVVTGSLRVEGGELRIPVSAIQIMLRRPDGVIVQPATPEKDLTFQISSVPPGKYSPQLFTPEGFYIKSIKVDDRQSEEVDAIPQAHIKVDIVLAAGGGVVTGTVEGPDGKPAAGAFVTTHWADGATSRPDREKIAISDAKGAFKLQNLPPGTYRVFAWDDGRTGEWRSAELRKEFEGKSATVKLTETGNESVTLKVIPVPQTN
ncbi:MAG: carboxypeptidase regulatory-like domain-containing protein [Bryobacteraceae bacterium]